MRLMVNGREVTNPAARAVAMMVVMAIVAFLMALLMFVALPLLGVAIGAALGLLGVGAGSVLIGIPLAIRRGRLARGGGASRSGELPPKKWRDAEETEYTIEDVPPEESPDTEE